jgi:hypothetical protein
MTVVFSIHIATQYHIIPQMQCVIKYTQDRYITATAFCPALRKLCVLNELAKYRNRTSNFTKACSSNNN